MGLAVPTALGVALAQPDRRVVCVTGDGEMLMGIGSLGVVGDQAPANLAILVLDNESFGETGRQRGLTSGRTDIAAVAKGFGIAKTHDRDRAGRRSASWPSFLFKTPGPVLAVAKIAHHRGPLGAAREGRRHHRPPLPRRARRGEGLISAGKLSPRDRTRRDLARGERARAR